MNRIVLNGLDGSNPLAYFAAIGALLAVDDLRAGDPKPTLHWELDGVWRPVLRTRIDEDALVEALHHDLVACRDDAALTFTYDSKGKPTADLKPSPSQLAEHSELLAKRCQPDGRRAADWWCAFVAEGGLDDNDNAKPTAFHFTAGQQRFLTMAGALAERVSAADLEAALQGPWTYGGTLPVLAWDNTESRDYALRASDPSRKKTGNPGADWLAVRGLAAFTIAARAGRTRTPGVTGSWKRGAFEWAVWAPPLGRREVASLVHSASLADTTPQERLRRGVLAVYRAAIHRTDQGGYGSFSAAQVI